MTRARRAMLGLAVAAAVVGSVTYAIAAMSFTPPVWVAGSASSATDLRDVASVDATSAYAVGAAGTILRTVDGGATWSAMVSETTATLNAIELLPSGAGWAVGANGAVSTSSDGTHWAAQPSGVGADLFGVRFADTRHGWAVGASGTIIATTDGGSVWATQSAGVPEATTLRGVDFVDSQAGWAWGDGGTVVRTTDGGSTWTTGTAAAAGVTLHAGAFTDAQTGWVAGSGGIVRKTIDGGSTWVTQTVDTTASLFGITFIDADHGFLVGGESTSTPGVIAGTADGGATWHMQAPGAPGAYRSVRFADADHGWIVGDGGTVLRTLPPIVAAESTAPITAGLAAPVVAYARALDSGEVLLGWTESTNATAPVTYRVSRSIGGGSYASLALVPASSGPSLVDTSAPVLETVAYTVSAIDPTGESSASAPTTVVTKAPPGSLQVRPATMSCTGCHSAHAARRTEVHPGADGRCFQCHESDIGERLSGDGAGTRHDLLPADRASTGSRLACANCHQPHVSSESTPIVDPDDPSPSGGMPRVTDAFCLRCHDDALPTSAETARWAPVPLGPDGASAAGVDIKKAWGSDIHASTESTADPRLRPEMGYVKGDVLKCATCHDPHGSTNRWTLLESLPSKDGSRSANALLVSPVPGGGADLRLFCAGCHTLASHPAADLSTWPLDCTGCHSHGRGL